MSLLRRRGIAASAGSEPPAELTGQIFVRSSLWFPPSGATEADATLLAGGGGGGYNRGGGGGAGGLKTFAALSISSSDPITVDIGLGGRMPSTLNNNALASDGGDTAFGALASVTGGGAGGSPFVTGATGGSGGGGGHSVNNAGGSGTAGEGNGGGAGGNSTNAGGGGGAGTAGGDADGAGGASGEGLFAAAFGARVAGGGGGGTTTSNGATGVDGGGNGGFTSARTGGNGTANTGGGGGGGGETFNGGFGGTGRAAIEAEGSYVEDWPAAWTPASLVNLKSWYDADQLVLSDTDSVTEWTDQSGNGFHLDTLVGTGNPTYRTNQLNSLPVVRFDGQAIYRDLLESVADVVFVVYKAATSNGWVWSSKVDGNATGLRGVRVLSSFVGLQNGNDINRFAVADTDTHVVGYELEASGIRGEFDGCFRTDGGTANEEVMVLGGWNGDYLDVDIAEVVTASSVTALERAYLRHYLADKWGVW